MPVYSNDAALTSSTAESADDDGEEDDEDDSIESGRPKRKSVNAVMRIILDMVKSIFLRQQLFLKTSHLFLIQSVKR